VRTIQTEPRVHQVRQLVIEYVSERGFGRGDRLPSEPEMAALLGVSRNTLREAYVALEAEGQVVRRHGIGTFVAGPRLITDSLMDDSLGFVQRIEAAGFRAVCRSVSVEAVAAEADAAEFLQIAPGAAATMVRRVIDADTTPAVHAVDVLDAALMPPDMVRTRFAGNMLEFLMLEHAIASCSVVVRYAAVAAPPDVAEAFRVRPGTPVIRSVARAGSPDGRPLAHTSAHLNSRIMELEATRTFRRRVT